LAAIPGTNGTAQLSWASSAGAVSYQVKQSAVSGSGYVTVGSVAGTRFTVDGLANGTPYYFVVSAAGVADESTNSSQVSLMPGSYPGWALGAEPVAYCR
jgi:cellulose 1,4-beta-cellobiosidase